MKLQYQILSRATVYKFSSNSKYNVNYKKEAQSALQGVDRTKSKVNLR